MVAKVNLFAQFLDESANMKDERQEPGAVAFPWMTENVCVTQVFFSMGNWLGSLKIILANDKQINTGSINWRPIYFVGDFRVIYPLNIGRLLNQVIAVV